MVNYRRVVCEVALLAALVALAAAAPAPDCTHTHYDQRQNGSENYRLNIDGVVIAVAPAETMLSAMGDLDDLLELALEEYNTDKPKPPQDSSSVSLDQLLSLGDKPQESKPEEGSKPSDAKPLSENSQDAKPEALAAAAFPLSDVSLDNDLKIQKKEVSQKKHEKAQRLKNRLAAFLVPLLRKTRHH